MLALWMYFFDEQTWLENPAPPPQVVFGGTPRDRPFFSYSEKKLQAVRPKRLPLAKPEPEPIPAIVAVAAMVQAKGFCHGVAELVDVDLEALAAIMAAA